MAPKATARMLILAVGLLVLPACETGPNPQLKTLQQKVDALEVSNAELQRELAAKRKELDACNRQVGGLSDLGASRLQHLFTVHKIELARLTGGADYDGQPGDDGVTAYLRPLDAAGDVLKAAGEITIELIDTSAPGSPRSLGVYVHDDPDELADLWYGGFMTDHYTVKCPWDSGAGLPSQREVTVKATFLDYLTGKTLTATEVVEVDLPPER